MCQGHRRFDSPKDPPRRRHQRGRRRREHFFEFADVIGRSSVLAGAYVRCNGRARRHSPSNAEDSVATQKDTGIFRDLSNLLVDQHHGGSRQGRWPNEAKTQRSRRGAGLTNDHGGLARRVVGNPHSASRIGNHTWLFVATVATSSSSSTPPTTGLLLSSSTSAISACTQARGKASFIPKTPFRIIHWRRC